MIRRPAHAVKTDRFSKLVTRRHKKFKAAVLAEVDGVVVKQHKNTLLIDDLLIQIHPVLPNDLAASWISAALAAMGGSEWPGLCWQCLDDDWMVMIPLERIDQASKASIKHTVTMDLAAFGVWLRSQQW